MRVSTPSATELSSFEQRKLAEGSIEPMTAGQVKRLGEIALSLIPTDATKGFAQQLVNGDFLQFVGGVVAEKRLEWRREHSRLKEFTTLEVEGNCGGTMQNWIMSSDRRSGSSTFLYRGNPDAPYSVWDRQQPATPRAYMVAYHAIGTIEQPRMVEALGGKSGISDPLHFSRLRLSPLQIVSALDSGKVDWGGAGLLFLVGQHHDSPVFLRFWRQLREKGWHYEEEYWSDPTKLRAEGTVFVFGSRPF